MKIIVAHEGKQHSFKTAEALLKNGILFKYITTVYDKPYSLTRLLKTVLKGDAKKKCETRRTTVLPDNEIKQFNELAGIFLIFLLKISLQRKFIIFYYDWLHDSFGKKVARYAIANNVDAVIMYDSNANSCWRILKKEAPHIKRIMDVSIANRLFMKDNYIKDIELTKDNNLRKEQFHLWSSRNIKRYLTEINDTDFFLVASNIVKDSLLFSGVKENQISIIPYGVEHDKFSFIEKKIPNKPLKLIYVGQITYRKGIHHLLKVISTFPTNEVELYLIGGYNLSSTLYRKYRSMPNVHFLGFVTRDILADYYQRSDVFVFPTLGEGYGLVILEALSCGIPCIVSNLAGGNDAIIDSYNGFEFKAGNDLDLKLKIQWFLDNGDLLPIMSNNSRESSLFFTWERYFDGVVSCVNDFIVDK